MTAQQVVDKVRELIGHSTCSERELYELLMSEAYGWQMRLHELDEEED
jgi:hypothetical protein